MKQHNIPFKERQRNYNYQFDQLERQEKLAVRKEIKECKRLKEKALAELTEKGGEQ